MLQTRRDTERGWAFLRNIVGRNEDQRDAYIGRGQKELLEPDFTFPRIPLRPLEWLRRGFGKADGAYGHAEDGQLPDGQSEGEPTAAQHRVEPEGQYAIDPDRLPAT